MKTIFILLSMFVSLLGYGQDNGWEVTGTVKSKNNSTLIISTQVEVIGTHVVTSTDSQGKYRIKVNSTDQRIRFSAVGFISQVVVVGKRKIIDVTLNDDNLVLDEVVGYGIQNKISALSNPTLMIRGRASENSISINSESYNSIKENIFLNSQKNPLSTFAVDVDAASYAHVRRMILAGQLPVRDAIRIEEMMNYFDYDLKSPTNGDPVTIKTELTYAPWNTKHKLLRIALKAKDIPTEKLPSSNFVFLIDVSGSMNGANRLGLVQSSIKLLVDQLRDQDKVAIVTYAGNTQVKLLSTSGDQKMKIKNALDDLIADGSTAGGDGIRMAYKIAQENFIKGGNNRIIMASDGDFNVGASSDEDMEILISKESKSGISMTVLGYGMGNYKDSKMEILADKGHGNYAYIDNILEARKAIVKEFGATLFTVAKDVKVQVEFNPNQVQAYRLIGYENRLLEAEDFNNDQKMGGDMGVGHSVTVLYEVIPFGVISDLTGTVDPLKYQDKTTKIIESNHSRELATIKFRYKDVDSNKSKLQETAVKPQALSFHDVSSDFRFVSAVVELGMLLRDSEFKQNSNFESLIMRAKQSKGRDDEGYRAEFIRIAESAKLLSVDKK